MMDRKTIVVAAAAMMAAAALAEGRRNLITNFDHRDRLSVGLPIGWTRHMRDRLYASLDVTPQADGSLRIEAEGQPFAFYEQRNLKLVPGGKYRISYEVKTSGLHGAPIYVFLRDSRWDWNSGQQAPNLPDDTKGEWVRQEGVVTMCSHEGATEHTLSICCLHAKAVEPGVSFSLRNLKLEAVDDATDRASAPIGGADVDRLVSRIVPVEPRLADVNAEDARMTFYWPGEPACGKTNCTLVAQIRGQKNRKPARAAFDAKGYAAVGFGRLWPSKYDVEVSVEDASGNGLARNEYAIVSKRPEKPLTVGRRLNNLVTALVDQPLADGEVAFSRATPGWVWISFEGDVGTAALGYLDDVGYPAVRYRGGERHVETQRFVAAGAHRLRIVGAKPGGRLRINAVKTIWGQLPSLKSTPTRSYRWSHSYTLPFCNRFDVHTVQNTMSLRARSGQHVDPEVCGYAYERGMRAFVNVRVNPDGPLYDDFDATWKTLTEGPWLDGFALSIDENRVTTYPRRTVNYSEAAWKMIALRPKQALNLFYADTSYGNHYDRPQTHVSEISATINSGNGTGLICPEMYAAVRATPAELDRYVGAYGRFVTSALDLVPASRGSVVLYGASYVQIGDWSNYVVPSTDIKAHYARMYRAFATDPRFAECAGIGCGGMICGGEELLRWVARLVRYHALEGGTENLADAYGFDWAPGFVKNADMGEGLSGWVAKGEIAAERLDRYGVRIQRRQAVPRGFGDAVATFTTRAASPNELSQEVKGLKPGACYAVLCCVADRDAAAAGGGGAWGPKAPIGFSVRLEGASEVPELRLEKISAERWKVGLRTLRYVFRANSPSARLVFVDRNDDGSSAPEGFRQALNYISFMPYYVEPSYTPSDVASALGWRGPDRIRGK